MTENENINKCTMISILLVGFTLEIYLYSYLHSFNLSAL